MINRLLSALTIFLCLFTAQPVVAAVVAYTDFASWTAAVSGYGPTTDQNFNGAASNFAVNSTGNTIGTQTTVALNGGGKKTGDVGLTGTGYFEGALESRKDVLGLDFSFATGAGGFALDDFRNTSLSKPKGLNLQQIGIVVGGQSFLLSDLLGLSNSSNGNQVGNVKSDGPVFIGFTSDIALSGFSLIHGDFVAPGFVKGNNEKFYIGSLTLASPPPSTVPVPAALPLLLAGLGAFGVLGWRRRYFKLATTVT